MNYQNPKQTPIPDDSNKLTERRHGHPSVMIKSKILGHTSGAVLGILVRIPRKAWHNVTHISAMFGGMGGKDDIMESRCGDPVGAQDRRTSRLKKTGLSKPK